MRKKLTPKYLDSLKCQGPRRLEIWDIGFPGLGLRVSESGRKIWFFSKRIDRRLRRITLGPYPNLSLSGAHQAARAILNDIDFQPSADQQTLGEVIPQFIDLYAKPKNRNWKETERLLMQKFQPLHLRPLRNLKRSDVVKILDQMVAAGRSGRANKAMAAIKKLLNWSLNRGLLDLNPIAGLPAPGRMIARDRILTDKEIVGFIEAARTEGHPFGSVYLVLLLTGQRRGEVSGMRWSEIDLQRRIWTIPQARSKNGLAHEVPLTEPVLQILTNAPRFLHSDFVFTTTGKSPVSGFGRAKERIEAAVGAQNWWIHDVRRTAASGMARLSVPPHVIEKVLNHKTGQISGVAAVYNRYGYETEKRQALEKWSHFIFAEITTNGEVQEAPSREVGTSTRQSISRGSARLA